jgi:hypothetical protein
MYYVNYCKILTKVIKEAKKIYYDCTIPKSNNKIKTTWSIIKKEIGYNNHRNESQALKLTIL